MSKIKVGLLGYGNAGRVFHAPLIVAEPRLELTRIGSRDFSDKTLPQGATGAPILDVVNDPDIDLVVVATPNDSHASLAELALRAGKHVVVDKPFTLDSGSAARIVQLAEDTGKMLSVFQNRRWDGGYLTARDVVDDGLLGSISYGAFHFDRYSPAIKDRWREWDRPGAGILYDLGPHLVDQIVVLFGMPDAVTANLARQRQGAVVDDFFHIVLEFGPTRIVAHASSLMPDHAPRISLFGARACLFQYGFDGQEDALKRGERPGDPQWGQTPGGRAEIVDMNGERRALKLRDGQYEAFYAGIADAICDGAPLAVTGSQALEVMRVLDAAKISGQTGTRVML
ncbi:oxidoreductase [Aliisedimentitalea scapharcae]|uniref:Oxidoreductase n=1 Tax=Aliisedimentitalea scapharcae TaxID=1524259 RepID=A0ABZ2XXG2_9RHOB